MAKQDIEGRCGKCPDGETIMDTTVKPNRFRPATLVWSLGALLLIGGAWGVRRQLEPKPIKADSLDGLVHRLAGEELEAIHARDELIRREGARNLAYWQTLLDEPSARVRYWAADTIAEIKTPDAARAMGGLLRDQASVVRLVAVNSFPRMDRDVTLPYLLAGLKDHDHWVRETAARQLTYFKDPRTVPALIRAIRDPQREVQATAMMALRAQTGQNIRAKFKDPQPVFEDAVQKWEAWWEKARPKWRVDPALVDVAEIAPAAKSAAPDFDVRTIQGDNVSLRALRRKVVLVNFWATTCPPCLEEMHGLQALWRQYGPQGFEIVGLEVQATDLKPIKEFAQEHGLTFKLGIGTEAIKEAYGHIHEVPVSLLIDRTGQIRYQWDGERESETYEAAIKRILAEK
jgi:peroxiredoxin